MLDDAPAGGLRQGAHAPGARVSDSARAGRARLRARRASGAAFFAVVAVVVVVAVSTLPGIGEVRARLESGRSDVAAGHRGVRGRLDARVRARAVGGVRPDAPVAAGAGAGAGRAGRQRAAPRRRRRRARRWAPTCCGGSACRARSRSSATRRCSWPPARCRSPGWCSAGLLTGVGALPGSASPVWTLVPAAVAALVIGLAVLYAMRPTASNATRAGGSGPPCGRCGASCTTAPPPRCTCCATATRTS